MKTQETSLALKLRALGLKKVVRRDAKKKKKRGDPIWRMTQELRPNAANGPSREKNVMKKSMLRITRKGEEMRKNTSLREGKGDIKIGPVRGEAVQYDSSTRWIG